MADPQPLSPLESCRAGWERGFTARFKLGMGILLGVLSVLWFVALDMGLTLGAAILFTLPLGLVAAGLLHSGARGLPLTPVDTSALGPPEQALFRRHRTGRWVTAVMLLLLVGGVGSQCIRAAWEVCQGMASQRCVYGMTDAAERLRAYQRQHGRYPASLQELGPELPACAPTDFRHHPYAFKASDDGASAVLTCPIHGHSQDLQPSPSPCAIP